MGLLVHWHTAAAFGHLCRSGGKEEIGKRESDTDWCWDEVESTTDGWEKINCTYLS